MHNKQPLGFMLAVFVSNALRNSVNIQLTWSVNLNDAH